MQLEDQYARARILAQRHTGWHGSVGEMIAPITLQLINELQRVARQPKDNFSSFESLGTPGFSRLYFFSSKISTV
jgi:hypothetical protein